MFIQIISAVKLNILIGLPLDYASSDCLKNCSFWLLCVILVFQLQRPVSEKKALPTEEVLCYHKHIFLTDIICGVTEIVKNNVMRQFEISGLEVKFIWL